VFLHVTLLCVIDWDKGLDVGSAIHPRVSGKRANCTPDGEPTRANGPPRINTADVYVNNLVDLQT